MNLPFPLGLMLLAPGTPFYGDDPTVFYADFTTGRVWDGASQHEVTVEDILSNTRAGAAWVPQANGIDKPIAENGIPRSDLGLHLWAARANLFANPDLPSTQTVSLASGTYICWMRGPGSIALTGTFSTAPAGAVAEGAPRTFAVNATRNITFTISGGQPTFIQLEKANFASPAIHGQQTRNQDVLKPSGAFLAALKQAEATIYIEWLESTDNNLRNANRRFIRASTPLTGSPASTMTIILNGTKQPNAAMQVGTTTRSATISTPVQAGVVNGVYFAVQQNDSKVVLAKGPAIADANGALPNPSAVALPGIADGDWRIGARNDTGGDPFNGAILKWVIWPRRLADSALVPFDPRPVPPVPFTDYPAIETDGGAAGGLYVRNSFDSSLITKLRQAGARKITTDPALQGAEPASGALIQVKNGHLSWRGHKNYLTGVGGNYVLGGDSVTETTDVILEDLHFLPGDGALGRGGDDRDGLGLWSGKRIVIRNCVFAYSVDEAVGMYREGAFGTEGVLFEHCIFGPTLKNVIINGELAKPDEPLHNFGLLTGKGSINVAVRYCLFAGNRQRNPEGTLPKGHVYQNNIVYNVANIGSAVWGIDPVTQFLGVTAAIRNNLYKAGPQSPSDWMERCQVIGRIDRGSAIYFDGNACTDGINFAADTLLARDRIYLRNGASINSRVDAMPFGTPYDPMPTATAQDREALWNYVMDRVGVRSRDVNDAVALGDAAASPFTAAVIAGVKAGTLGEIVTPGDFVGYPFV